jgi:hypothetical protein
VDVLIDKVVDPDPVIELGLNVAPAPDGSPFTLNATLLLKPFEAVMFTL